MKYQNDSLGVNKNRISPSSFNQRILMLPLCAYNDFLQILELFTAHAWELNFLFDYWKRNSHIIGSELKHTDFLCEEFFSYWKDLSVSIFIFEGEFSVGFKEIFQSILRYIFLLILSLSCDLVWTCSVNTMCF